MAPFVDASQFAELSVVAHHRDGWLVRQRPGLFEEFEVVERGAFRAWALVGGAAEVVAAVRAELEAVGLEAEELVAGLSFDSGGSKERLEGERSRDDDQSNPGALGSADEGDHGEEREHKRAIRDHIDDGPRGLGEVALTEWEDDADRAVGRGGEGERLC